MKRRRHYCTVGINIDTKDNQINKNKIKIDVPKHTY